MKIVIFIGILFLSLSCNRNHNTNSSQYISENSISSSSQLNPNKDITKTTEEINEIDELHQSANNSEYFPYGIIEKDSIFLLVANINKEYKIFGYDSPSTLANKLFLFSVSTRDVEGNPYNCKYGSFYESYGLEETGISLKYVSDTLHFRKLKLVKDNSIIEFCYIEKEWLKLDIAE